MLLDACPQDEAGRTPRRKARRSSAAPPLLEGWRGVSVGARDPGRRVFSQSQERTCGQEPAWVWEASSLARGLGCTGPNQPSQLTWAQPVAPVTGLQGPRQTELWPTGGSISAPVAVVEVQPSAARTEDAH